MGGGGGGGGFGGSKGSTSYPQYSGNLEKVNTKDASAEKLADKIDGESTVKFDSDPKGREFDAVSDEYIAQAKPAIQQLSQSTRNQMKATFEAAKETKRSVYYHFNGEPAQSVIDKLKEYSTRYGVKVVIDTEPF